MVDVDQWVKEEGRRLLFIYGEYDPWTAGAFDLGSGCSDCFKLIAPAGNHGSDIGDLGSEGKAVALDAVRRWAGVSAKVTAARLAPGEVLAPTLEGRPRL
jgi:hypothetical protein